MRGWKRIILFFCLFAAWAFALDFLIDVGLKRVKTSQYGVINLLASGRINANIVVSGSSRALSNYDPVLLEEITGHGAYNIGQDASHIDMQLALFKMYLKHNDRPHLVIQNLDMHSLESTEVLHEPAMLIPYLADDDLFSAIKRIEPAAWKWRILPLSGYATEDVRFAWLIGLGALVGVQPFEDTIRGYRPSDESWNTDFARFRAKHPNGVSYEIDEAGIAALQELITLCRGNDIPLLLVYSPQYDEMLRLVLNRDKIFATLNQIASDSNVPLWDFTNSDLCREKANFYNSQHLNRRGATQFSRLLAERLKNEIIPTLSTTTAALHGEPAFR